MKISLLVPGALDQLTGGYLFARHVVDRLRKDGHGVQVFELEGRFPAADDMARDAAMHALASLPNDDGAVIDGLALAGFAECLSMESARLRLLAWIHHPLTEETGLSAAETTQFRAVEARLLPRFRGILCPSRCTADAVVRYGVDAARVAVAPPGTTQPVQPRPHRMPGKVLRLLTIATVTPRKGHLVLIEALAQLRRRDWRLDVIGSLTRDPIYAAAVRQAIATHRLETQIALCGEMTPSTLSAAYDAADLFVLPSFHEGYGMVFAEALAHGLPIVATNAGAIPETVPERAAILVQPGSVDALAAALTTLIEDRAKLAHLAQGAADAGAAVPDWPQSVALWRREAERLLA